MYIHIPALKVGDACEAGSHVDIFIIWHWRWQHRPHPTATLYELLIIMSLQSVMDSTSIYINQFSK